MNSQPAKTRDRITASFKKNLEKTGAEEIELLGYLVADFIGIVPEDFHVALKEEVSEAVIYFSRPDAVQALPESLRPTLTKNLFKLYRLLEKIDRCSDPLFDASNYYYATDFFNRTAVSNDKSEEIDGWY